MTKVLFICTGNICRSPTAEIVFQHHVRQARLQDAVYIDSAGTHDYHTGEAPDGRTQQAALKRGFDMSKLVARQVDTDDFHKFDYILAMDHGHLAMLKHMRPNSFTGHLGLFMEFSEIYKNSEVPDPYYGNAQGFEKVLDMVEDASRGLLEVIAKK
jgi:protein-tyrosine phosphatase